MRKALVPIAAIGAAFLLLGSSKKKKPTEEIIDIEDEEEEDPPRGGGRPGAGGPGTGGGSGGGTGTGTGAGAGAGAGTGSGGTSSGGGAGGAGGGIKSGSPDVSLIPKGTPSSSGGSAGSGQTKSVPKGGLVPAKTPTKSIPKGGLTPAKTPSKTPSKKPKTSTGSTTKVPKEIARAVQQALMSLGYDLPKYGADGDWGNETKSAMRKFQSDEELPQTGTLTTETIDALDRAMHKASGNKDEMCFSADECNDLIVKGAIEGRLFQSTMENQAGQAVRGVLKKIDLLALGQAEAYFDKNGKWPWEN